MFLRTNKKGRNAGLETSHEYISSRTAVNFLSLVVFSEPNILISSSSLYSSSGIKQRPLASKRSSEDNDRLVVSEYKLKTPDNATKASRKWRHLSTSAFCCLKAPSASLRCRHANTYSFLRSGSFSWSLVTSAGGSIASPLN